MQAELTTGLLAAAASVGVLSWLVASRDLPAGVAAVIVIFRVAVPVIYFGYFYNGVWTFNDDFAYLTQGRVLVESGYNPFTIFFDVEGLGLLILMSNGFHILYGWWNHLAAYLFGPHYYAPVLLNVLLTFVAAKLLLHLTQIAGFSRMYSQALLLFYLLHWETVAWSSFINAKDILVATLTLVAFVSLMTVVTAETRRRRTWGWIGLAASLAMFPWIRFYMTVLLLASFAIWLLLRHAGWLKYLVIAVCGAVFAVLFQRYSGGGMVNLSPVSVVFGFVRMVITPQPWSIAPNYSFLLIPALLHWLFLGAALVGGYLLYRRTRAGALLLIYLGVTMLFYAMVPELQGPRQRLQTSFVWIWMQFHALYHLTASMRPGDDAVAATTHGVSERDGAIQPGVA